MIWNNLLLHACSRHKAANHGSDGQGKWVCTDILPWFSLIFGIVIPFIYIYVNQLYLRIHLRTTFLLAVLIHLLLVFSSSPGGIFTSPASFGDSLMVFEQSWKVEVQWFFDSRDPSGLFPKRNLNDLIPLSMSCPFWPCNLSCCHLFDGFSQVQARCVPQTRYIPHNCNHETAFGVLQIDSFPMFDPEFNLTTH